MPTQDFPLTQTLRLRTHYDAVIVGSGHNGLVAAAYLALAGRSVLVLERLDYLGGATTSARIFPDYNAWLSRYAYLVSLFPAQIRDELGLSFETRRRRIASFTPYQDASGRHQGLLLANDDERRSRDSLIGLCGDATSWDNYQHLLTLERALAKLVWPSLLEPLRSRQAFTTRLNDGTTREAWQAFVERPLGETLERLIHHDILRGLVMTDAKIGVFTHPHDPSLLQNRCFLYHVIGNETGEWRVPVGGMRSLVDALTTRCRALGVDFLTRAEVTRISPDTRRQTVLYIHDEQPRAVDATRVLVNAGPSTFARLLHEPRRTSAGDEGSVIKLNMLLRRLPRVKARDCTPAEAWCGSLHIDEGYAQMIESHRQASRGELPDPAPAEVYCHTLTDPSILAPDLTAAGYHTLTLFGLDMPYRLFRDDPHGRREQVQQRYLAALNRICDEPFEDCLARDRSGTPCLEIKTPLDLEHELDLDQGNIFHNELTWFFTDDDEQVGKWGVETRFPGIYLAGSSALRGGAVSGIPGRNAAMCLLQEDRAAQLG